MPDKTQGEKLLEYHVRFEAWGDVLQLLKDRSDLSTGGLNEALPIALDARRLDVVRALVLCGANADRMSSNRETPLLLAIENQEPDIVLDYP